MATKEDVEAYSKKYGDPLSGGVIIRDENGKEIGRTPYSAETDVALKNNQKFYQVGDNKWSTTEPTKGAYVDLDKKTGKITLKNLNSSITQDRAKKIIEDMRLETLSANYKANPNYAYPVSEGSKETVTVEDIIADYNKKNESSGLNAIETYVQNYTNVDNQAKNLNLQHQMITENGEFKSIDFSDTDILNYFTNQKTLETLKNTSIDKLTDATRIAVPLQFAKDFGLTKADSWDLDTTSIGAKDFMENYYNRQNANWDERQKVNPTTGSSNLDIYNALERYISGQSSAVQTTDDGQTYTMFTHRDDQTQDLAAAISLYNFLTDVDPICSFWQGAGDTVASAFNGVEDALEKAGEAGATGLMLLADGGAWVGSRIREAVTGQKLSDEKAGYPSRLIAKWAGYSGETSFYDVSGAVRGQGVEALQSNISKYNAAAASTFTAAEFLTEMAVMINVGNAFANSATGFLAERAASAASSAKWWSSAAEGAQTLANVSSLGNGMRTMWQLSGNTAKAASTTLNLLSKALQWKGTTAAVSVLAESVGEALIQNPSLVGQLLTSDNLSPEARQFAMNTVYGNAFGMAVGHWGGKALQKFGDTPLGMGLSRNLNRVLWTIKTWAGDSIDAARLMVSKYDDMAELIKSGNPNKYQARMNRQMLRMIQKEAVKETDFIELLGKSSDEILEQISKYDENLGRVLSVENAIDFMSSRGIYTAAAMVSDPNVSLSGSYKRFQELANDLIDLGESAGLKATTKGGVSLLPEKISDYITTKQHIDILNSYAKAIENGYDVGESLNAINKELTHFNGVLDELKTGLSAEILAKSDEFIDANRKLWSDWTDYRVEKGLLSTEQIASLRKSEQWGLEGELYVGQMRKVEQPKYTVRRRDNLRDVRVLEEVGRYKFGSTQGFVDPMLTFQGSLIDSAQKADRMAAFAQFAGTEAVTTKYTAQQMNLVKSVQAGKKALANGVSESFASIMENVKTGKVIDSIVTVTRIADDNVEFVIKSLAEGDLVSSVDDMVDGLYDFLNTGNRKVTSMLDSMIAEFAPEAPDEARKFLIYSALQDNIDDLSDKVKLTLLDELPNRTFDGMKLDVDQINEVADSITDSIKQNIKDRFDYNRVEVSRLTGKAQDLIDREAWNKEIRDLAQEMGDAKAANPNLVTARNANGEIEIFECDPILSTFMNFDAPTSKMDEGMLAKINYAWMKLFRFGTTGPNPVSWVNQFFRDFGNAWLVGGATQTIAQATDILEEAFGANPAYYMSQFSEEFLETAKETAQKTGKTVERVLAEAEIEYGGEIVGKQTEHEALKAYRNLRDAKYINGQIDTGPMSKALEKVDEGLDWADGVNKTREEWLRTRVYANNYAKAISQGKTISQARTWAQFYSSNATTNFTRATTFLAGIQNTVPYLRSAINGTKSFWRLWQVDPVGVTGRIVGGLVVPMIGLTALTLNDEENRKVYKNIKEYQKDGSLAFVVGGQAFFVPIPQEVSTFINPIRQMMESMYDVSTNSFAELAFSDVLALSPVDLSGFAGLDNYKIYEDGFWERMQAGVTKVAAQCLPKYANTLIALTTNRDLYTGNRIDTSYTTIDPDTGEARVMDYTSGQAAKALHNVFPGISAAMAENIMKNTIGQVGIGVGNWIVDMFQSVTGQQSWEQTGENIVSGLTGAVTSPITNYIPNDEANVAWRQAVSEMYAYKKELMNRDDYKSYMTNATNADTETEINALAVQRQNIVEPYFDKVKQMVDNYRKNYGRELDQAQLASVISLMVMYNRSDYSGVLSDEANDQAYASARASALQTMNRLGFANTGGQDAIFGRVRTSSKTGEVYVEYNNPIAILDFQKRYSLAPDVHEAQMKNLLKEAGLTLQEKNNGYYSLSTKAEKKQYRKDWNAKVAKALAPYIQMYGAEAIFRNNEISEAIDDYFYTDNYYSAKEFLQEVFEE